MRTATFRLGKQVFFSSTRVLLEYVCFGIQDSLSFLATVLGSDTFLPLSVYIRTNADVTA
jgi:hypothetical protein